MISIELLDTNRPTVVIARDSSPGGGAWAHLQTLLSRGVVGGSKDSIEVRAEVFLAELSGVREVRSFFDEELVIQPRLTTQLQSLAADRRARELAIDQPAPPELASTLAQELRERGFKRELRAFQLDNLASILRLPHGADFSVPGAGKTTVALAGHTLHRARGYVNRLLVIAPIAAFQAWKEDSRDCIEVAPHITVHGGPGSVIPAHTDILLTNYNRVAADYDRIRDFVSNTPTHVILDEAHRIKRGALGVHGRAVLDLAYVAKRRDVLTGTPAPQGAFDLVAPMRFLYPGQDRQILPADAYVEQMGRDADVLEETRAAIAKYFVRTPKSSLGLPNPVFNVVKQPMGRIQSAIYDALVGRYRGTFALAKESRREFDRIGRITMYLLEAAANPALLVAGSDSADEDGFTHPPLPVKGDEALGRLLAEYREFEKPWKYAYVRGTVEKAAAAGEKVLVWTTFVRNIRALARELGDFNPAVVHGGVPTEDGAPPDVVTREAELERFRNDPECSVLLANPAACGEGISLHHWCHHAIYLDRTFNAGHFLQSQDRIHRLGLSKDVETRFTLLLSENTIDEAVDERLRDKVRALSKLMNDPGLVRVALPESDEIHDERPAFEDDLSAVKAHLSRGGR